MYNDWVEKDIEVISRIDARSKRQPVRVNNLGPTKETSTLMILSDEWVYLFGDKGRKSTFPLLLYVTLIAGILLVVYKQTNQLKGHKILKQKFLQELEWDTINDIVLYCGGNPQKIQKFRRRDKT
ncbi:hypothetical protein [Runella slithyformis]|uniref:hypothetical protein n=1 Tax=Runella slithyformis TaxID=106 RepID=UPI0002F49CDD|nr:hypothetical protein [Runella slithyformis]